MSRPAADPAGGLSRRRFLALCGAACGLGALAWGGGSLYCSAYGLEVSRYQVEAPVAAPVRIAHLSDQHNAVFGPENAALVELVAAQQPDLIFLTGDQINRDEPGTASAERLIRALAGVAPVYCSLGNHEQEYQANFGSDPAKAFARAGAVVLEKSWQDITVNGSLLRVGGLYGYALPAGQEKDYASHSWYLEECAFLRDFCGTARAKLLLCHMPVSWIQSGSLDSWAADVVFAGHAHGGQVRLPFVGGLYAPDQGWFPGRECGLYFSADGARTLVLSRGLGGRVPVPRFNNVPELVVAELIPSPAGQS